MQNMAKESNYITNIEEPPWREGKGKGVDLYNFENEWILEDKKHKEIYISTTLSLITLFLQRYKILKPLYMYIGIEELSKYMADGGSLVSHGWSGRLQIRNWGG